MLLRFEALFDLLLCHLASYFRLARMWVNDIFDLAMPAKIVLQIVINKRESSPFQNRYGPIQYNRLLVYYCTFILLYKIYGCVRGQRFHSIILILGVSWDIKPSQICSPWSRYSVTVTVPIVMLFVYISLHFGLAWILLYFRPIHIEYGVQCSQYHHYNHCNVPNHHH